MIDNPNGIVVMQQLYRKRKIILLTIIVAGISSILVTMMMPKKYLSKASFYPPIFNADEDAGLIPQIGFGMEADRFIQMGQSFAMKDSLIEKFDLYNYYKISTDKKGHLDQIYSSMKADLSFERTKSFAVEVSVRTKDPVLSADITNAILNYSSMFWEQFYKENVREPLEYAQLVYQEKNKMVSALMDSIHLLRSANQNESLDKLFLQIKKAEREVDQSFAQLNKMRNEGAFHDYGEQVDLLNLELVSVQQQLLMDQHKLNQLKSSKINNDTLLLFTQSRVEGGLESEKLLISRINQLKQTGSNYAELSDKLELELLQLQDIKNKYENQLSAFEPNVMSLNLERLETVYKMERQNLNDLKLRFEKAQRFYSQPLPNIFIIERARPSFQSNSPSYKWNLIIAVVGSFLFICLVLVVQFRLQELRNADSN